MKRLTPKQKAIVDYIYKYIDKHCYAPSYREVQSYFGFASLASVYKYVQTLKEKGWITSDFKKSRSITVQSKIQKPAENQMESGNEVQAMGFIPFIGYVSIGKALETFSKVHMRSIPTWMFPHMNIYLVEFRGKGLEDYHIQEGDLLFIDTDNKKYFDKLILAYLKGFGMIINYFFEEDENVVIGYPDEGRGMKVSKTEVDYYGSIANLFRNI